MSRTHTEPRVQTLPGASIVRRIRVLLVIVTIGLVLYSAVVTASRGACTDDVMPTCMQVDMHPNPAIAFAVVGILLWALTRVLRRAADEDAAVRTLDRTAAVIVALLVVAVIASHLWLQLVPLKSWNGPGGLGLPFPFSTVELTRY